MDNRSAEVTKYANNSALAMKISFMNEWAMVCENLGADIDLVRAGIGADSRIGPDFLFPGVGYGGSCFPKDTRAAISFAQKNGSQLRLVEITEEINERQKQVLVEKVKARYGDSLHGKRFAIWGLAFKPRTDDMREAPAVTIVEALLNSGASVAVHDPEALDQARGIFGNRVTYHSVNYDALEDADALLVVTEWNDYHRPDLAHMIARMKEATIYDGRNIYNPKTMRAAGFNYYSIGRGSTT